MSYNAEISKSRTNLDLTMSEFTGIFVESPEFLVVAETIVRLLMADLDLPPTDPKSAVHTYGRDESANSITESLRQDVMKGLTDTRHIHLVNAFLHPGGVYYVRMCDVLDEYWNYIDIITDSVNGRVEGWGGEAVAAEA
jgi:hypothetical protein